MPSTENLISRFPWSCWSLFSNFSKSVSGFAYLCEQQSGWGCRKRFRKSI